MKPTHRLVTAWLLLTVASRLTAAESTSGDNPADNLPPHISRVTWFGERADWSHDGKRILFLVQDLRRRHGDRPRDQDRCATYRRITLTMATRGRCISPTVISSFPAQSNLTRGSPARRRVQCWLYVLDRSRTKAAEPLGTKCSEGPAVSRKRLHIAWTHVAAQYPDEMPAGTSRLQEADIVYADGKPRLAKQQLIVDSRDLPFRCTLESQNFRPPDERELIFSAYGYQGTDVAASTS